MAGQGRNEEVKNLAQVAANQEEPVEEGSDTFRESQLVPGEDPEDINLGNAYIFIQDDASAIMHRGKSKVNYVFVEGAHQPQFPPPAQPEVRELAE